MHSRGDDNGIWFRRSCQTVYVHPDWNNDIGVGDIALCILDEDVDVEPVEVAPGTFNAVLCPSLCVFSFMETCVRWESRVRWCLQINMAHFMAYSLDSHCTGKSKQHSMKAHQCLQLLYLQMTLKCLQMNPSL